ncbi:hypothetical protein HSX11_01620 [Oxalobacteraceae bacterium]|nr:hypothetical protein [Oxalobacteraceae bacterium]
MARSRNIKPGLYKNEDLAECSIWARFIFPGLWMLADRAGRLEDRPKRIKGELLAYDSIEIDPLLDELVRFGFILRYEVDGKRFIQICKFAEHQTPHVREQASDIPAPQNYEACTEKALPRHDLGNGETSPRSPDSLIPDSLIPDTGFPTAGHAPENSLRENSETRSPTAVDLSIAMRAGGIATQPADPRLMALASQGVEPDTVAAACAEARRAKPGAKISAGYVFAILGRWADDAAALRVAGAGRPPPRGGSVASMKVAGLDHTSTQEAMAASMKKMGTTVPEGEVEFN